MPFCEVTQVVTVLKSSIISVIFDTFVTTLVRNSIVTIGGTCLQNVNTGLNFENVITCFMIRPFYIRAKEPYILLSTYPHFQQPK